MTLASRSAGRDVAVGACLGGCGLVIMTAVMRAVWEGASRSALDESARCESFV